MNFKDMLEKITALSEAVEKTKTGLKHTADAGGYGRKDDDDEDDDKKKKTKKDDAPKKRGRPKKGADETGEKKEYDWSAFGVKKGKDVKLPKHPKEKTKTHKLKEYFEQAEQRLIQEMMTQQPIPVVGKQGSTQSTGAGFLNIDDTSPAGQAMKDAIGKLAQQKKAQIVMPTAQQTSTTPAPAMATGQQKVSEVDYSAKKARAGKDIGKPGKAFAQIAKTAGQKYGSKERGEKVAGAVLAKLRAKTNEADQPPNDALASPLTMEAKKAKPDYIDLDKDGNKKESMKKAASDAKKEKKKVDESMNHKHKAAHHRGKSHALAKEGYNCHYEDMEEARCYHEGYKEGLDECYGMVPGTGVVGETKPAATVPGMASQAMPAMEADVEEGNAFTAALAKTPKGGKFTVGGKTFTDRTNYDARVSESPFAFEAWDNQLQSLLESKEEVAEGMTVSISKGQQGAPDSVSVSAQDGEADQLLSLIKSAGLGLFGGEEKGGPDRGMPITVDEPTAKHGDINVVGDHDGMMALIKKVTGAGDAGGHDEDYEEEGGHDHGEEPCESCGKAPCGCEEMSEDESMDQREEEVAEDNAPDSGAAETTADENAEAQEDEALAKADELNEWANDAGQNGTEETFVADADFMINDITSGLNKRKSTGQTTIPVIAGQMNRMVSHNTTDVNESINDWIKLAGIK